MKYSSIYALVIVVVLTVWMASGMLQDEDTTSKTAQTSDTDALFRVEVDTRTATETPLFIQIQGQTMPNRAVTLRAQTESQVLSLTQQEGNYVDADRQILVLDRQDRDARLAQSRAELDANQSAYERLKRLSQSQYLSENELERALASVKASQAAIKTIEQDIAHTRIVAPFAGHIQDIAVEKGDVIRVGDTLATLIETNPLKVEVLVSQQVVNQLSVGQRATVKLATGENVDARVHFISPQADMQSRTFRAELLIDNPDFALRAGVSATVKVAIDSAKAHYLSPALFSLSSDGTIGVKMVNDNDEVVFHAVEIVQSDERGSWVTGLPNTARIIVSGQGFVQAGMRVKAVEVQR